MSKLYAMICPARGGKSTYCKQWLKEPDPDGLNRVVVNADNIRLALYNKRYEPKGEGFVHATYEVMVRSLLLNDQLAIMMDDTHCSINSIRKVLSLDPNSEFVFIDTPVDECKARAIKTSQSDLLPVIDRMYKNLYSLVRKYHPDIAIREDGTRTDEELFTAQRLIETIESIRQCTKVEY